MRIVNTIEIKATAERVFYWLEDPERAMKWMSSVSRSEIVEETPEKVGTRFREYVEENGRGLEMHGMITSWEENSRLGFHLESDVTVTDVEFTLDEERGVTRLTQSADMQFKGPLKIMSVLFGAAIVKRIKRQAHEEFLGLKRLCENDKWT
jgi:uncharacterized protein YndB with AHSA1/START domain